MQTEKQRERLVELIKEVPYGVSVGAKFEQHFCEKMADHLIRNGVKLAVMCCECKYCQTVLNIIDEPKLFCTRLVGSIPVDFADYCSYGKLKEMQNGT